MRQLDKAPTMQVGSSSWQPSHARIEVARQEDVTLQASQDDALLQSTKAPQDRRVQQLWRASRRHIGDADKERTGRPGDSQPNPKRVGVGRPVPHRNTLLAAHSQHQTLASPALSGRRNIQDGVFRQQAKGQGNTPRLRQQDDVKSAEVGRGIPKQQLAVRQAVDVPRDNTEDDVAAAFLRRTRGGRRAGARRAARSRGGAGRCCSVRIMLTAIICMIRGGKGA